MAILLFSQYFMPFEMTMGRPDSSELMKWLPQQIICWGSHFIRFVILNNTAQPVHH